MIAGYKVCADMGKGFMLNREQIKAWFPRQEAHYDVIVCGGGVRELLCEKLEPFGSLAFRLRKATWTDGDGLHVHPDYLKLAMMVILGFALSSVNKEWLFMEFYAQQNGMLLKAIAM